MQAGWAAHFNLVETHLHQLLSLANMLSSAYVSRLLPAPSLGSSCCPAHIHQSPLAGAVVLLSSSLEVAIVPCSSGGYATLQGSYSSAAAPGMNGSGAQPATRSAAAPKAVASVERNRNPRCAEQVRETGMQAAPQDMGLGGRRKRGPGSTERLCYQDVGTC